MLYYMEINVNYQIYVVKMFLLFQLNSTQLLLIKRNNQRCNDPQKHLIILYLNSRVWTLTRASCVLEVKFCAQYFPRKAIRKKLQVVSHWFQTPFSVQNEEKIKDALASIFLVNNLLQTREQSDQEEFVA